MKRDQLETEIKYLGQPLQIGQSLRAQCPVCQAAERSLSVTREASGSGLLYNCYRASCGARGFVGTIPNACDYDPNKLATCMRQAQPYTGELHPLKERDYEYFARRFDLRAIPDFTISRSSDSDARSQYVFSLQDYRGYTRGHAVRRGGWSGLPPTPGYVENTYPKTRTYMLRPDYISQHIAFPSDEIVYSVNTDALHVVVVEDYVSSLKVAQAGRVGVALMGTHMNAERAREISLLKPSQVIIALDKDATENAMHMARQWGLSWEKTRVVGLQEDIKDMTAAAVQEILS